MNKDEEIGEQGYLLGRISEIQISVTKPHFTQPDYNPNELKYKIWSQGLPCIENPITFYERTVGASKMSRKIVYEAVINVFRLRMKKILGTLQ